MILFYILNASLCCCYRYYDSFLPFLLEACNDEYPDVRQVHCPFLVYYILMLLIQFWDVIEALSNKTIKFLCRLLFMVLVFVLSLVDLFSTPLLEVSCTIPFAYFVVMPYYIYFLDKCFCSIAEALSRLDAVIRHPNALHADNIMAYDNAVSALGKICQFHRDSINAAQVFYNLVLHVSAVF